jgi:hypothetical protein
VIASPSSGGAERAGIEVRGRVSGVRVLDNLFVAVGGTLLVEKVAPARDVVFQGNAYWAEGRAPRVIWDGREHVTLEAFRSATGQEQREGRPVGLDADPLLAALERLATLSDGSRLLSLPDLRLRPGSPLLGAGVPLAPDAPGPHDFFGVPVDPRRPGIGASGAPPER